MTLTIYDKLEQGSEGWFAARRGIVTASVVASLLSVRKPGAFEYDCPNTRCNALAGEPCLSLTAKTPTPIKTFHGERTAYADDQTDAPLVVEPADGKDALSLTALLTAERITDYTEDTFTSNDMLRGKEAEPFAVDTYSKNFAPVTTVGLMVLEQDGWRLGFSPDGLVGDEGLVEVKAPRQKTQLTTVLAGKVPADHMAQLQAGLLVSGRKWIDFLSFNGGMHLWRKRVYPIPAWHSAIIAAVKQFEATSADMIARYNAATIDLPMTERVVFEEIVI